jgi:predicted exporter
MIEKTARRHSLAVALWLLFVLACGAVVSQARIVADLSAFLPRSPTEEQKLLVDLLREGLAGRLILIGIEGSDAETRARLSKTLAEKLRATLDFASADNGIAAARNRDREFLFAHRYLLSAKVAPARFTVAGLHEAIAQSIALLASPAGLLAKSLLPRDPTGELTGLLDEFDAGGEPAKGAQGVWVSRDGQRAVLLARTRASGADMDGQQRAVEAIRRSFEESVQTAPTVAETPRLLMTGPGVFAVASRASIQAEAARLSILGSLLIVALLLAIYRSVRILLLGLLPVVSGALAGAAAVSLGFGVIHGVTLGFGVTLIGEAVDYSIYLFVQSDGAPAPGETRAAGRAPGFWPTIRLGVATSLCGFASLLFSGFPGLAQLGLYSMAGLATAAAVARYVLPALKPQALQVRDMTPLGLRLAELARRVPYPRALVLLWSIAACALLYPNRDALWRRELSSLSPVPAQEQTLDASLRADLGAPDVRYLTVVSGPDQETVLAAAETLGARLRPLIEAGVIAGFDTPARFLPSLAAQEARLASLPEAGELQRRLALAVAGLPVRAERFAPFVADAEAARHSGAIGRADLEGTSLALAADGLLTRRGADWIALLPLKAPISGPSAQVIDAGKVRAALAESGENAALLVDLKSESDRLYANYLREAIQLSLAGLLAIVALLFAALRSIRRVFGVMAPLAASVLTVAAGLSLAGGGLGLLHLIGLLLIVAVGSNYALFFDRRDARGQREIPPRTLASLLFANLSTVAGFGLLAFSKAPVLQALGAAVGPGAVLALFFSAILAQGGDSARRP